MDFVKKHYEKLILSLILLGLCGAVGYLPFKISREKQELEDIRVSNFSRKVAPIAPLDLADREALVQATRSQYQLQLGAPPHNLCTPVPWIKAADGHLIKVATGREIGPDVLQVTKITPLYLTVSLENINPASSGSNYLYLIKTENQSRLSYRERTSSRYLAIGDKTDALVLKDVKGPPDKPTALVIELRDTSESGTLAQGVPYRRVESYTADLKYDPDKQSWRDKRVGSTVPLGGEEFTIASINLIAPNQYEVVLSAKQTGKKTTIKFNAAP